MPSPLSPSSTSALLERSSGRLRRRKERSGGLPAASGHCCYPWRQWRRRWPGRRIRCLQGRISAVLRRAGGNASGVPHLTGSGDGGVAVRRGGASGARRPSAHRRCGRRPRGVHCTDDELCNVGSNGTGGRSCRQSSGVLQNNLQGGLVWMTLYIDTKPDDEHHTLEDNIF